MLPHFLRHGSSPPKQNFLITFESPMPHDARYWFPAKRYVWGWAIPITWEGWAALAAFLGLIAVGLAVMPPARLAGFIAYVAVLSIALTGVCWWKGEPPRWRWGGD